MAEVVDGGGWVPRLADTVASSSFMMTCTQLDVVVRVAL